MNKRLIFIVASIILLLLVFLASFFGILTPEKLNLAKKPARAPLITPPVSLPPTLTPTPTIDWKPIHVPEPGESPPDADTAVPKYTYGMASGGKIRVFDILAQNDKFTPKKIIVYQKDRVRLYLTSADKTYDMTITEGYGNSLTFSPEKRRLLEFGAAAPGRFSLICRLCDQGKTAFESAGPTGILLVKPVTAQ